MKAIIVTTPGGVESLNYTEIDKPAVNAGEVLVQVKAISINPVDVKTRAGSGIWGRIKDLVLVTIGWDISGVITEAGEGVSGFNVGDEVFGMVNFPGHGKAYAEYVAVPASQLALKPSAISHEEAAAATLAALTAWQAIVDQGHVRAGQRVLVHAASGGVGHFAVQIAKSLGAYVIGTSSGANRDFVLSLGADEHIDYTTQRVEKVVKDVDFVLDTVGGDTLLRSLDAVKAGGTVVSILGGFNEAAKAKADAVGVTGHNILVYSDGEDMTAIAGLLESGKITAHIHKAFPFEDMAGAHLQVESGRTVGKVVVTF